MQHRFVRRLMTPLMVVVLLFAALLTGSASFAQVPTESTPVVPNATGLMGSRPPQGDPLKLGKKINGNTAFDKARSTKGSPRPPSSVPSKLTPGGPYYFYGVGSQTITTPPTGVSALLTVSKPYVNPTWDWHTLAELAVQSADGNQVVEIGWTRDQATFGDNLVHLFVYHWINGQPTCYGCNFVDYAANTAFTYGSSLESYLQTDMVFAIEHSGSTWWLGFGPQGSQNWIGSFPDSEWVNATPSVTTFQQVNRFQGFGEVAAGSAAASCADMGTGPTMVVASAGPPATGAKVNSVTYTGQLSTAVNLSVSSTVPQYPVAIASGSVAPYRSFRYGGGGWC